MRPPEEVGRPAAPDHAHPQLPLTHRSFPWCLAWADLTIAAGPEASREGLPHAVRVDATDHAVHPAPASSTAAAWRPALPLATIDRPPHEADPMIRNAHSTRLTLALLAVLRTCWTR